MFYRCTPAAYRPAVLRASGRYRGTRRRFTVDIHCHVLTPRADELARPHYAPETDPLIRFASEATREVNRKQGAAIRDKITSTEARLAAMDAMGIDMQAISPAPSQYFYWTEPGLGREIARAINDNIADIVQRHPDRFVGIGTVPMQAPDLAVAELERAVKELGLRGVELATNVEGAELADERFRPVFAKAEELGILVFLHPSGTTEARRLTDHYFINVIGNPLDSTIAVSHLIFGGVLDAYPRLKICVAHGGGFLPAYSGRMDHAHAAREDCRRLIRKPPTSYLKKLYFDTIVFTPHQLEYLVRQWGSGHVLLGTDYPYDMGMYDPIGFIESAKALGGAEKAALLGGNAAKLLRIRLPAKAAAKSRARPQAKRPKAKRPARAR
jgi:aminocarboxymuconate-semialdehyde decarboxylase